MDFYNSSIHKKTQTDILTEHVISRIKELAPFYAPEWKFDPKSPDAGSALALIFARQLAQSMDRFNKMPFKHRLALYSLLGEDILPARPSSGFVHIEPQNRSHGSYNLSKGFKLYSSDADGKKLSFETLSDVMISPAVLSEMIFTDYKTDTVCFWDGEDMRFEPTAKKSERRLELEHEYFGSGLSVYLNASALNEALCDKKKANPYYINSSGERTATECTLCKKGIRLDGLLETADGINGIGFDITDVTAFENAAISGITAMAEGEDILPSTVLVKGEEQDKTEFYPFGKDYMIYDDAVFFCPSLNTKDADVTLSFDVCFDIIETGEYFPPPLPKKKLVIRKKNIPKPKIYDITPESVEWEYYNGSRFAPLTLKQPARNIFSDTLGGSYCLKFTRPSDMESTFVGSTQGYCVRARVSSVKNAFKRPARIFAPRISNMRFSFRASPSDAFAYRTYTHGEMLNLTNNSSFSFSRPLPKSSVLYLGFDKPIIGENVRLFVECSGGGKADWQLLTNKGWHELDINDCTDAFSKSGMISFAAADDMPEQKLYGKTAHWIRVVFYGERYPKIKSVYLNAVDIRQCETAFNETYFVDSSGVVKLKHNDIFEEKLYIGKDFEKALTTEDYRIDRAEGIIEFSKKLRKQDGFSFRIDCRYGGGEHTNLPSLAEFYPAFSKGNIGKVTNPLPLLGGREKESLESAAVRIGKELKHSKRCVTARDYLDLIDDPQIAWSECFFIDDRITLVVLIKDYKNEYAFSRLRRRTLKILNELRPEGIAQIEIRPPAFVPLDIKTELVVKNGYSLSEIQTVLNKLCDPILRANNVGLNSLPNADEIHRTLTALSKVSDCRSLFVLDETKKTPFCLPIPGKFDIKILHEA